MVALTGPAEGFVDETTQSMVSPRAAGVVLPVPTTVPVLVTDDACAIAVVTYPGAARPRGIFACVSTFVLSRDGPLIAGPLWRCSALNRDLAMWGLGRDHAHLDLHRLGGAVHSQDSDER